MQCAVYGLSTDRLPPPTPTPSTSAAMLAALIRLFPKHNIWIWRWARALNFFGRPWRGLFWVEPVLLNRCMVLVTVLQLSFRVLPIFLKPTPSLCRATIFFLRSSESYLPWGVMLNFQWPVWESESDNTTFNTPAPLSHLRPCNTNEYMRKWLIGPDLDIFTYIYVYICAFSRRFYPKRLTLHSGYTFFVSMYVCSLGT